MLTFIIFEKRQLYNRTLNVLLKSIARHESKVL